MKSLPIIFSFVLVGCSTINQPVVDAQAPRPMAPITIDCAWAGRMTADLERIIARPETYDQVWDSTFNEVAGTRTAQQRLSSAKTVLWTVRTRCPGF